jgi:hypothetical protein
MTAPHLSPETAVAHAYELTRASAEAAEIERHAGACAECSQRLKSLRTDRGALAEALRPDPLPAAEPSPLPAPRRRPWIEAVAATLCLAAVGFGLFGSWRDRQPAGQSEAAVQRDIQNLKNEDPKLRQEAFERLMKQRGGLEAEFRQALEQARDPELKARLEELLQPHEIARLGGIVSAQADGSLRYSPVENGAGFRIGPDNPPGPAVPLAWSPDGKWLAYRTQEDLTKPVQLHLLDILSGRSLRLSLNLLQMPVWSADSRMLAFATPDGISIASGADWEPRPLHVEGLPCFFSRDDAQMYLWRPSRIERLELVSRKSVLVAEASSPAVASLDGATFYYFGLPDGRISYGVSSVPLMQVDLAGGAARVLKEGAAITETTQTLKNAPERPALSPRGDGVAWVRATPEASEIRVLQLEGLRELFQAPGSGPAWSPTGTRLAFETPTRQIRILNLDGFAVRDLPGGSPVWVPKPSNR